MTSRLLAALLFLAACSAQAETYKWVDEKGVTNYSSTPPSSSSPAKAVKVEDRLSTYQPAPLPQQDPAASAARADYAQAEWLQRQQIMALQQNGYPGYGYPYPEQIYPAYYSGYPAFPLARARALRASFATVPSLHTPRPARGVMARFH